jgi:hypothetical protein
VAAVELQRITDKVTSSSDVHAALVGLVRAILGKTTPAGLYSAERALIGAVEDAVRSYS